MAKGERLKDPEGGLTAAGRKAFAKRDGSHLRPGVQGAADTPSKQRRKGSFLRRHFATPRGPMVDEKGEPTRLALSAHAWGEKVPKTLAEARRLAAKGTRLLEQYAGSKEKGTRSMAVAKKKSPAKKKAAPKKSATKKKAAPKKAAPKKAAPKKKSATKSAAKKKTSPKKNSLVGNINARKRAGKSRPKSRSTISKKAYAAMEKGWK